MHLEKGFYIIIGLLCLNIGIVNANVDFSITEQIGKSVILECPIDFESCGELHSLNWFKGDERIAVLLGGTNTSNVITEYSDRVETEHAPYRLKIRDLRIDDEDIYTCDTTFFVPQETCEVSRGYRIELNVLVPPSEILIVDEKGNKIINNTELGPLNEGNTLKASCIVKDTRPRPEMIWYRGNKRLTTHSPTYEENEGLFTATLELSLVLSRQDLTHDIECRIVTPALDRIVKSIIQLDLQVQPTGISLSGVEHHTVQGTRTTLTCEVFGARPVAHIIWKNGTKIIDPKNDDDMADMRQSHIIQKDGTYHTESQLIFTATRFENDVIFGCDATNAVLMQKSEKPMHSELALEVMYPPVVRVTPDNIVVNATESVLLNCEYVANPASLTHVQWYKNGDQIRVNETSRFEGANSENAALIIRETHRGDGGNYSCELSNSIGTGVSDTQIDLDVQYVPIVELLMIPEGPVKENDETNVTLFCNIIDANPSALQRVRWYANSSLLKELPDCNETNEDFCNIDPSKLLLESIGRGFAYNYSCEGYNAAGWGPRSDDKELVVYYEPGPAALTHYPLIAIKKKSVIFSCSVDVPGVPEATRYRWFRGGQTPLVDVVTKDWTVDPVGLDSRTEFSCYAYNEGGHGIQATVNLDVHAPPFFIKNLVQYTGVLYSTKNASLMCRVECVPRCEISWLKDNISINKESNRYFIKEEYMAASPATGDFESMMSVLHFNMSAWPNQQFDIHSDNANYSCVSSENGVGPGVRSSTYLNIEYKPENTTVSNDYVNVIENTIPGTVICSSKMNPEFKYEWFYRNESVTPGNTLKMNYPITRNRTGTYTCVAHNKHGSDTAETYINVQYKPTCEIERKIIDDEDTLICTAFGNPEESGFQWSINTNDTAADIGSGRIDINKSYFVLEDDLSITRTYRCVANNTVGVGQFCIIEVAVRPKRQLAWWQRWDRTTLFIVIATVLAILLAVIIICCIIICICRRRRRQDKYHTETSICATQSVLSYQPSTPLPTSTTLQSTFEVPKSPPKWPLRPGVMVHVKNDTKQNLCANRLIHKRSLSSSIIPTSTLTTTITTSTITPITNQNRNNNNNIDGNTTEVTIETQNILSNQEQSVDSVAVATKNTSITNKDIHKGYKSLPRPLKSKSFTTSTTVARVNPNNTILTSTLTPTIIQSIPLVSHPPEPPPPPPLPPPSIPSGLPTATVITKNTEQLTVPPERPPKLPRRNILPVVSLTNRIISTNGNNELLPRRTPNTSSNSSRKRILGNLTSDDDDDDDEDENDTTNTIVENNNQNQLNQDGNSQQIGNITSCEIGGVTMPTTTTTTPLTNCRNGGSLFEKIFGEIFSKRNEETASVNSEKSENKLLRYFGMSKVFKRQRLLRSDSNISESFAAQHRIKGIRCSGSVVTYKKTPALERNQPPLPQTKQRPPPPPPPIQQLLQTNNKEKLVNSNCNALIETEDCLDLKNCDSTTKKIHDKSSSLGDPLTEPGEYENLPFHGLQTAPNKFTTTPINFNNQTNVVRVAPRPKLTQHNNNLIYHQNHLLQQQQQQQQQQQNPKQNYQIQQHQQQQQSLQIPNNKSTTLLTSISPSSSATLKSISSINNDKRKPLITNDKLISSSFPTSYTEYYHQQQQKCSIPNQLGNCFVQNYHPYTVANQSINNNIDNNKQQQQQQIINSNTINNPFLATNFKKFHASTGNRSGCGTITSNNRKKHNNNTLIIGPSGGEKKFYSLKALKNKNHLNLSSIKPSTLISSSLTLGNDSKCKRHHSFAGGSIGDIVVQQHQQQQNQIDESQIPYVMQPKIKFYEPPMYENLTDSIQIHESDEFYQQQQQQQSQSINNDKLCIDGSMVNVNGIVVGSINRKTKQHQQHHQHQHQKIDKFNNLIEQPPDERISIYRSDSGISNSSYECITPIPAPRQTIYNHNILNDCNDDNDDNDTICNTIYNNDDGDNNDTVQNNDKSLLSTYPVSQQQNLNLSGRINRSNKYCNNGSVNKHQQKLNSNQLNDMKNQYHNQHQQHQQQQQQQQQQHQRKTKRKTTQNSCSTSSVVVDQESPGSHTNPFLANLTTIGTTNSSSSGCITSGSSSTSHSGYGGTSSSSTSSTTRDGHGGDNLHQLSPHRTIISKEPFKIPTSNSSSSITKLLPQSHNQNNNLIARNPSKNSISNNQNNYSNDNNCLTTPSSTSSNYSSNCISNSNKIRYPGYVTRPVKLPLRKHHSFNVQQHQHQQQQQQQTMLGHLKLHQIQREKAKAAVAAATSTSNNITNPIYKQNGGPLIFKPFLNENTAFKPISPVGCNGGNNSNDSSSQSNSLQSDCSSSNISNNSSYITTVPRICGTSLKRHMSNVESYDSNRYPSDSDGQILNDHELNGHLNSQSEEEDDDDDDDDDITMNQDDDARSSASSSTIVGKRLVYVDIDTVSLNMRSNRNYRIYEKDNSINDGGCSSGPEKFEGFTPSDSDGCGRDDFDDLTVNSDTEQFRGSNRLRQISSYPTIKDKNLKSIDINSVENDIDNHEIDNNSSISKLDGVILATPIKRATQYATLKYNEVNI